MKVHGWEVSLWKKVSLGWDNFKGKIPSPLEMRNLIAHPRCSHWDMNQIKLRCKGLYM